MAELVSELRNKPRDEVIEEIITRTGWTASRYGTVSRSSNLTRKEKKRLKAEIINDFKNFYEQKIILTENKNVTAYYLSRYSGREYLEGLETSFIRERNEHHIVRPVNWGRIVYKVDHSGHSNLHWLAYLETGKFYHIRVAQSQNCHRFNERRRHRENKISSLQIKQLQSISQQTKKKRRKKNTLKKQSVLPQIEISKMTSDQEVNRN